MSDRLWCEWAWLGGPTVAAGVVIELAADRISRVDVGRDPPPAVERLSGVTLPGLVDAHSHAFHRALRGRTQSGPRSFWTWREQMYELAARLEPDTYHDLARAWFAEMALAGTTTVGEFHYLHHAPGGRPYADPDTMGEALLGAAAAAGIRLTLVDTAYLRGGFGEDLGAVQRRFADASVEAWAERVARRSDTSLARTAAAVHSVRTVPADDIAAIAAWAAEHGTPLHAHVSEQPAENAACLAAHGLTPTGLLAEAGALGPRFTAVHATHVDAADVARLGEAGATCCLCPTTERDLADGIAPARALVAAGALLALGSDSHAVVDPFEEARAVELHERLVTGQRGHLRPDALLAAATAGGARSLGWPDAGRLAPGQLADLVVVGLDTPRLAGTDVANMVASIVHAASAADVRHVMVGGRWIVRDGTHAAVDVVGELQRVVSQVWA